MPTAWCRCTGGRGGEVGETDPLLPVRVRLRHERASAARPHTVGRDLDLDLARRRCRHCCRVCVGRRSNAARHPPYVGLPAVRGSPLRFAVEHADSSICAHLRLINTRRVMYLSCRRRCERESGLTTLHCSGSAPDTESPAGDVGRVDESEQDRCSTPLPRSAGRQRSSMPRGGPMSHGGTPLQCRTPVTQDSRRSWSLRRTVGGAGPSAGQ